MDETTESHPKRRAPLLVTLAIAIVLGVVGGYVVGGVLAGSATERDEDDALQASGQEDELRVERDVLDSRVKELETQTKPLAKVVTDGPLLASEKSTTKVEPGTEFSVDGGTYVVRGLSIVDSFESKDERRPAKEQDGYRWLLVDTDYTNRTSEDQAPACGTSRTIRAVLADGTTAEEFEHEPPVHPDTYDTCGNNLAPGKGGRWVAPILVKEGSTIHGILVADVYARTTDSEYNVQSGKAGWIQLDEPIEVGDVGDDEITVSFTKDGGE